MLGHTGGHMVRFFAAAASAENPQATIKLVTEFLAK